MHLRLQFSGHFRHDISILALYCPIPNKSLSELMYHFWAWYVEDMLFDINLKTRILLRHNNTHKVYHRFCHIPSLWISFGVVVHGVGAYPFLAYIHKLMRPLVEVLVLPERGVVAYKKLMVILAVALSCWRST